MTVQPNFKTGKYNPRMNAVEQRHRARVEQYRCFCCGAWPVTAHHTLLGFPEKRWRRDHRFLLPVCHEHHTQLHDIIGNEEKWLAGAGKTPEEAITYMKRLWAASEKDERRG